MSRLMANSIAGEEVLRLPTVIRGKVARVGGRWQAATTAQCPTDRRDRE